MLNSENSRLMLVARPIAIVLLCLQVMVFCVAILAAGRLIMFAAKNMLGIEPPDGTSVSLLSLFAGAIVMGIVFLLKGPAAKRVSDEIVARIMRLIFISCDNVRQVTYAIKPQCLAVTPDFRKIKINHPTQKQLVEKLFENIRMCSDISGTFDVVLAPSGFGKTRTATLLAEALVSDRDLCVLANNLHYYDFARGFSVQNQFLRNFGSLRHAGALVVVDNFHLADTTIIKDATRRLLDVINSATERHLIIMAQPLENWRLRAGAEIRLLSHARQTGRLHSINALSREDISKAQLSKDVLQKVKQFAQYSQSGVASIAEIQSVQVDTATSVYQRRLATRVSDYLFAVNRKEAEPPSKRLVVVVATATALAIFKGVFDLGTFTRAFSHANPRAGLFGSWDRFQAVRELRLLSNAGVIPRSSLPGSLFVMHERLAEHLRDTVGPTAATFEEAFRKAIIWRAEHTDERDDPALNWLVGVETAQRDRVEKYFGKAMADGNLSVMASRLKRVIDDFDDAATKYQLGVILDKSGSFAEARKYLKLVAADTADSGFAAEATLALLEAEHSPDRKDIVLLLSDSKTPKIRLSARYWNIHMDAHLGRFDPSGLGALGGDLATSFDLSDIQSDHFLSTLASRVYFDTLRQSYLRGLNITDAILANETSPLLPAVEASDPCFKANTILYERAHVLSFVVLPELAVFDRRLDSSHSLGLASASDSVADLTSRIEQEYKNARDEFSVFGNREQYYLSGDILNAQIQNPTTDIDDIRIHLAEYQKFISKAGFADLLSYPVIYAFRLAVRSWRDALTDPNAYATGALGSDEHRTEAKKTLSTIKTLDEACGNRYGLWRHAFYETMLKALDPEESPSPDVTRQKLLELADKAAEQGFLGDEAFARKLAGGDTLRIATLLNAILYHPFVHQ